ncbi:hypothetical protein MRX96_016323 [Rhipicephalus microplus]
MDTMSTRKSLRFSKSGSDDEGASWKMQAVASERLTVTSPTTTSSDAFTEEHSITHDTDGSNETKFYTILSRSQKRCQRAFTSPGPTTHTGSPPATAPEATPARLFPGLPINPLLLRPLLLGYLPVLTLCCPLPVTVPPPCRPWIPAVFFSDQHTPALPFTLVSP